MVRDTRPLRLRLNRTDAALLAACLGMLAALLTVATRAAVHQRAVVLALYLTGGALEVAGAITVALELQGTWRRQHRYGRWTRTVVVTAEGDDDYPAGDLRERIERLEHVLGIEERQSRAWFGFAALLAGIILGTVANVLAA